MSLTEVVYLSSENDSPGYHVRPFGPIFRNSDNVDAFDRVQRLGPGMRGFVMEFDRQDRRDDLTERPREFGSFGDFGVCAQ